MNDKTNTKKILKIRWAKLLARWLPRTLLAAILIDIGFIFGLMPDWDQFIYGPVQKSRVIQQYEYDRTQHDEWPILDWRPVQMEYIPKHLARAVVVAEDSRFYQHEGFDQEAIKKAMEYNISQGRIVYGASTISQQTIKNFALSHSRDPLRKFHEAILTYFMEKNVGKERILEIYLNIVEFGRGIYGVEAAAQRYFSKSVNELTHIESAELAATLPSPVNNNPASRTEFFIKHRNKIMRHLGLTV